jgi:hypothetical protein
MYSNGMTKKELLLALRHVGDDDVIHFAYPSGDFWRTTLVTPVTSVEAQTEIEPSAYHRTLRLAADRDMSEDEEYLGTEAVVLFA